MCSRVLLVYHSISARTNKSSAYCAHCIGAMMSVLAQFRSYPWPPRPCESDLSFEEILDPGLQGFRWTTGCGRASRCIWISSTSFSTFCESLGRRNGTECTAAHHCVSPLYNGAVQYTELRPINVVMARPFVSKCSGVYVCNMQFDAEKEHVASSFYSVRGM